MAVKYKHRNTQEDVEAVFFDGSNTKECCLFITHSNTSSCGPGEYIGIYTPTGVILAIVGKWIVKRGDTFEVYTDEAFKMMFEQCYE